MNVQKSKALDLHKLRCGEDHPFLPMEEYEEACLGPEICRTKSFEEQYGALLTTNGCLHGGSLYVLVHPAEDCVWYSTFVPWPAGCSRFACPEECLDPKEVHLILCGFAFESLTEPAFAL